MTEETQALAPPGDPDAGPRWRTVRAKLLARRGQFPAARQLIAEAEALTSPTSYTPLKAEILMAKAEVAQLAGEQNDAERHLRAALRIYEDAHAPALAERVKAALAGLASHPGSPSPS